MKLHDIYEHMKLKKMKKTKRYYQSNYVLKIDF